MFKIIMKRGIIIFSVNLQPLNMDTGSMGSMVGLGVTPPQFTQEQLRLFLGKCDNFP